jgi:hypothetical protein
MVQDSLPKKPAQPRLSRSTPAEDILLVYVKKNQQHHLRIAGEQITILECCGKCFSKPVEKT